MSLPDLSPVHFGPAPPITPQNDGTSLKTKLKKLIYDPVETTLRDMGGWKKETWRIENYAKRHIDIEEVVGDLKQYVQLAQKHEVGPKKKLYGNDALQKRAKKVLGLVSEKVLPNGYALGKCADTVKYGHLMALFGAYGLTACVQLPGMLKYTPEITIDTSLQKDAVRADFILAHEGGHARTYNPTTLQMDGSEWLQEMVAYETILKLAKESPGGGFEGEAAYHMTQGATRTLVEKLQKRGKSDAEIETYLKREFNFHDDYVNKFVIRETDDATTAAKKKEFAKRMRPYEVLPYAAHKMLKNGRKLHYYHNGAASELKLDAMRNWEKDVSWARNFESYGGNSGGGLSKIDGSFMKYSPTTFQPVSNYIK